MKRDLNVIRYIFDYAENSTDKIIDPSDMVNNLYDLRTINHHIKLLADQHYVEIIDASTFSGEYYLIKNITMRGYDYRDNIDRTNACQRNANVVKNPPSINATFNIYNPTNSIIGNQEIATIIERKD